MADIKRLRCLLQVEDSLHEFADRFLRTATVFSMNSHGKDILNLDGVSVAKLHTDGDFQVELVTVPGNFYIPKHVHPNMDSIEVGLSGAVRFLINDVDVFGHLDDERLLYRMQHRGLRINRNDVHHGKSLPGGAVFLSIQRWDRAPTSVGLDYSGIPLGLGHEHLLAQGV